MKPFGKLLLPVLLVYLVQSCNNAPSAFTKGYEYYTSKDYDSSLFYFNSVLPEDEDWLDSARAMKIKCFEGMAKDNKWKMLGAANLAYASDTLLIHEGAKSLTEELVSIWKNDSIETLYDIIDNHKANLPKMAIDSAMNAFEDHMLLGYYWKGIKALKGQKLYFTREALKGYKGKDEGVKIHGRSALKTSYWKKDIVIYKNISYDSAGIFNVQPRIYKGNKQYHSKRGSMKFMGKDTIKVNYEQRLSTTNKVYFVRGDKKEDLP